MFFAGARHGPWPGRELARRYGCIGGESGAQTRHRMATHTQQDRPIVSLVCVVGLISFVIACMGDMSFALYTAKLSTRTHRDTIRGGNDYSFDASQAYCFRINM